MSAFAQHPITHYITISGVIPSRRQVSFQDFRKEPPLVPDEVRGSFVLLSLHFAPVIRVARR
jgi:hypothetical protein